MACVLGHRTQEPDHGSFSSRCAIGLHVNDRVTGSHGSHLRFLPRRGANHPCADPKPVGSFWDRSD
jgi:hypothetical protein